MAENQQNNNLALEIAQLKIRIAELEGIIGKNNYTTSSIRFIKKISMPNLPKSATGLSVGDLYNSSGTIKIV